MKKQFLSAVALMVTCAMTLCACGNSSGETAGTASTESTEIFQTEGAADVSESSGEASGNTDDSVHVLVQGLDAIHEKGKIVIGMMAAVPPYAFHNVENGQDVIVGSEIELIKEIADALDVDYEINDSVKILNGPLENFVGVVQEINKEKHKVKVLVSMFGRETPVELEFSQVQKV